MSVYRRASGTSEDWLLLLDNNYHHLCRSVRPEAFFSWLRCKGVLTLQDQEEVEQKYITTIMKSGHLIDIIKTKGYQGFVAFMEVVEYVYPETFSILMNRQPRKPPLEFEPTASIGRSSVLREKRGHALSAEILGQMGDLVNVLSKANACKREELDKLQNYVKKLQEENKTMCDANHSLLLKFKDAQEEIDQLKQKLTVLMSKHEHDTAERKTLLGECERLSVLKDKYMAENQKLCEERDDLGCRMLLLNDREFHRSLTCRNRTTSLVSRTKEESYELVKEKQKSLAKQEVNPEMKHVGDCTCHVQTSSSSSSVPKDNQTATQRINELEIEKDELEMMVKEWENQHTALQERYNCLLVNLDEVKTERIQMRHQLDDLQGMYEKEREENQRLVVDCSKYLEKFCSMEGQMMSLKQEIDELQAVKTTGPSISYSLGSLPKLIHNASSENNVVSSKYGKMLPSISMNYQKKKPLSRQVKVIDQTPGLCPDIKRQVVITNKQTRQNSTSSA